MGRGRARGRIRGKDRLRLRQESVPEQSHSKSPVRVEMDKGTDRLEVRRGRLTSRLYTQGCKGMDWHGNPGNETCSQLLGLGLGGPWPSTRLSSTPTHPDHAPPAPHRLSSPSSSFR